MLDGVHFDYIVHACGSGGTATGLIAGKALRRLDAEIVSISVCNDEAYLTDKIRSILAEMVERYGCEFDPAALPIRIVDGYKGRSMVEEARKGLFDKGSSVLFLHTGGIFGLMSKAAEAGGTGLCGPE